MAEISVRPMVTLSADPLWSNISKSIPDYFKPRFLNDLLQHRFGVSERHIRNCRKEASYEKEIADLKEKLDKVAVGPSHNIGFGNQHTINVNSNAEQGRVKELKEENMLLRRENAELRDALSKTTNGMAGNGINDETVLNIMKSEGTFSRHRIAGKLTKSGINMTKQNISLLNDVLLSGLNRELWIKATGRSLNGSFALPPRATTSASVVETSDTAI